MPYTRLHSNEPPRLDYTYGRGAQEFTAFVLFQWLASPSLPVRSADPGLVGAIGFYEG